jgi:hypothetical protein
MIPNPISSIGIEDAFKWHLANQHGYSAVEFGAVGDGVTDDTDALNKAFDAIRAITGAQGKYAVLTLEQSKTYRITGSINLTNLDYVLVRGNHARIKSYGLDGKAAFDLLGSMSITIEQLHFESDSVDPPSCHISYGRSTTGGGEGSSQNILYDCTFTGYWTTYAIYNDSCELCLIDRCAVSCSGPATAKGGIYYGGYDDESIPSDFVTRSATHSASMIFIDHCNVGGNYGVVTQYVPYYFSQCGAVSLINSFGYTYNDMPVVKTNGTIYGLILDNLVFEGYTDNALYFEARAGAGEVRDAFINNVHFGTNTNYMVYEEAGVTLNRMTLQSCEGVTPGNTSSMYFAGIVDSSKIESWWNLNTGALYVYDCINTRIEVYYHTVTIGRLNIRNDILYFGDYIRSLQSYHALTLPSAYSSQRNALTPVNGMLLFNTDYKTLEFYDGKTGSNGDGWHRMLRGSAAPSTQSWPRGTICWNTQPTSGQPMGWMCTESGTYSTATDSTGDTDGSTATITGMTDTSDFNVGDYVDVSAGFATTGPYRVISKTADSLTLESNSNATESNITVDTSDPVWTAMPDL